MPQTLSRTFFFFHHPTKLSCLLYLPSQLYSNSENGEDFSGGGIFLSWISKCWSWEWTRKVTAHNHESLLGKSNTAPKTNKMPPDWEEFIYPVVEAPRQILGLHSHLSLLCSVLIYCFVFFGHLYWAHYFQSWLCEQKKMYCQGWLFIKWYPLWKIVYFNFIVYLKFNFKSGRFYGLYL